MLSQKIISLIFFIFSICHLHAQTPLSTAQLKTMHSTIVPFSSAIQKDSLILICFWSVSSDKSIDELNAINTHYEKWKKSVPFRMLAVSIDHDRDANKVRPMVNTTEWKFDVYIDINGDLQKALNSTNLPQAMILEKDKVIYEQSGYEAGSENYLFQKMHSLASGRQ